VKKYSFKEKPETAILICSHLMKGADLHWVHHLPGEQFQWNLMCVEEHTLSDMVETTLLEAHNLFPEIGELADVPEDMHVSFKKGKNSGRWYDFHRSN
jgi:hypothetical protein